MKRDPGVEFMRILACLMVIGIHTALYAQVDGSWIFSRVFFNCIVADGVAVFFMITGFFLFQYDLIVFPDKNGAEPCHCGGFRSVCVL